MTDQAWRRQAGCRNEPTGKFFPRQGDTDGERAAMAVCFSKCAVRDECLADALETRDVEFGIRGGRTPYARQRMLGGRRKSPGFGRTA